MNCKDKFLDNYDYKIPPELIAQKPVQNRSDSRLFVIHKNSDKFEHKKFLDITCYLGRGDCIVINTTKVVPSRLFGKKSSGGKTEILFLEPCQSAMEYKVLTKPFLETGKKVYFEDGFECIVKSRMEQGESIVEFNRPHVFDFLQKYGIMPLPPYINRKNGLADEFSDIDKERYQTVYAVEPGAIAAPTAGLHFTKEVLQKLQNKGVNIARLTLHVGWGTFKPVVSSDLNDHKMMSEKYYIDTENTAIINESIKNNKKVASVGTTSARALESLAKETGFTENGKTYVKEFFGETSIFIYPGYRFRIINALITNFHLPKSTPLMMASAFCSRKTMLKAYKEAVKEKYRFFSYGDSMIII
ncbi:MAG: tRNA preQ1(34) S-adenosylmethionine ribosyltransferase-isomerase QueA [Endomicrobium sp.]|jgi:S-adenosylmethionine:tRNA ribosyltransferase-isomerase|nr:tRNA preQ1(34) S-adenosylmethionine ribosyltransferase-isomerase QueA [Endomicrobium sp.]